LQLSAYVFNKHYLTIDLIERSLNLTAHPVLWIAFEGADKGKLLDIINKWNETYPRIWRGMGFSDVMETFGEVSQEPMSAEDQRLLQSGLQKLERLNRDYLTMAVPRLEVLIQNELRPPPSHSLVTPPSLRFPQKSGDGR
jgi:hypothetical protein